MGETGTVAGNTVYLSFILDGIVGPSERLFTDQTKPGVRYVYQ